MPVGESLQLTTTATDLHGNVLPSRGVVWASGSLAIGTISDSGLLSGVSSGCARVTAQREGVMATAAIRVTPLAADLVFLDRRPAPDGTNERPKVYAGRVDGCITSYRVSGTVVADGEAPAVSRDGNWIAFFPETSDGGIHIVQIDGSNERVIAIPPGVFPGPVTWSPDGTRIAFIGTVYTQYSGNTQFAHNEVFVMSSHGGGLQQVTQPSIPATLPGNYGNYVAQVRWSPTNNSQLAFIRVMYSGATGSNDLFTVNVDGSSLVNLTGSTGQGAWNAVWSTDGTHLAYVNTAGSTIWSVRADGQERQQISTARPYAVFRLAWSPSGSDIAYTSGSCPYATLEVTSAFGDEHRILACGDNPHYIRPDDAPAWGRDGREIVYSSWQALLDGTAIFGLYAVAKGGEATRYLGTGYLATVLQ